MTGNAALGDHGGMVSRDLLRLKPAARRRAWRLLRIVLDVYRRAPERVATLERVVEAFAVNGPDAGRPEQASR